MFSQRFPSSCLQFGKIYEVRMMMDFNGNNRGYAFVTFSTKLEAKAAMKQLNNYEIRSASLLRVPGSVFFIVLVHVTIVLLCQLTETVASSEFVPAWTTVVCLWAGFPKPRSVRRS